MTVVKSVLKLLGFDEDRVWFRFISASEGKFFGETVGQMVARLKELGPNTASRRWDL